MKNKLEWAGGILIIIALVVGLHYVMNLPIPIPESQAVWQTEGGAMRDTRGRWAYEVVDGTPRHPKGYIGTVDTRDEARTLRFAKCRMGGYIKRVRLAADPRA